MMMWNMNVNTEETYDRYERRYSYSANNMPANNRGLSGDFSFDRTVYVQSWAGLRQQGAAVMRAWMKSASRSRFFGAIWWHIFCIYSLLFLNFKLRYGSDIRYRQSR
jgi:hypothetical protein